MDPEGDPLLIDGRLCCGPLMREAAHSLGGKMSCKPTMLRSLMTTDKSLEHREEGRSVGGPQQLRMLVDLPGPASTPSTIRTGIRTGGTELQDGGRAVSPASPTETHSGPFLGGLLAQPHHRGFSSARDLPRQTLTTARL